MIKIICEVTDQLYDKLNTLDINGRIQAEDVPDVVKDVRMFSHSPQQTTMADNTQTVAGKKLVVFIDNQDAAIEAVTEMDTAFPAPAFVPLAAFDTKGYQVGAVIDEEGVADNSGAIYPIEYDVDGVPVCFKYVYDVEVSEGVFETYVNIFKAMSAEDKAKADPMPGTTDFKQLRWV